MIRPRAPLRSGAARPLPRRPDQLGTPRELALIAALKQIADPITRTSRPLSPTSDPLVVQQALRPAAILFPLTIQNNIVDVVLTRRTESLRSHPGQISFPGGRIEPEDYDVAAAATREAHEEIGVTPQDVAVIGTLDTCITGTGFSVVPVLAVIPPHYAYRLDPNEVDEVFHVPLAHLMEPANHQQLSRTFNGAVRGYYAIDYGRHHIWGATARMIVTLYERIRDHTDGLALEGLWAQLR